LAGYATDISTDLISSVTDAVLEEIKDWQNRPLEPLYPVSIFDALRVKIRDEGVVKNKASWKDRKFVAAELKTIYGAVSAQAAAEALSAFEAGPWGQKAIRRSPRAGGATGSA
jgi:transposase-like protein